MGWARDGSVYFVILQNSTNENNKVCQRIFYQKGMIKIKHKNIYQYKSTGNKRLLSACCESSFAFHTVYV